MVRHIRPLVLSVLALGPSGCSQPLTEVFIVVDTDLAVPGELDAINVEVVGPTADPLRAMGPVRAQADLPATVGVVHSGGALGPVSVLVQGSLGGVVMVRREATFTFVEDEIRILRIHLLRSCVGVTCIEALTCGESGCRSVAATADELEPYQEDLGRIDAGTPSDDGGTDAGVDAGVDAGPDAGPDAGVDAGVDAGPGDPPCVGLPAMCGTGGGRCTCGMCTCDATCSSNCEVRCSDSDRCDTDARMVSDVEVQCANSTCVIDARMASNVTVLASMGADVEVDCSSASSCDVECAGGSRCLVRCQAASTCDISMCPTMVMSCPMQIIVCGRACP